MSEVVTAADVDRRNAEVDAAWDAHVVATGGLPQVMSMRRQSMLKRYEEQNGLCAYCDGPMVVMSVFDVRTSPELRERRATCDHVTPRALGGSDDYENIVAACHACNSIKGNIPPRVWVAWITGASPIRRASPPALREYLRLEANAYRARVAAGIGGKP